MRGARRRCGAVTSVGCRVDACARACMSAPGCVNKAASPSPSAAISLAIVVPRMLTSSPAPAEIPHGIGPRARLQHLARVLCRPGVPWLRSEIRIERSVIQDPQSKVRTARDRIQKACLMSAPVSDDADPPADPLADPLAWRPRKAPSLAELETLAAEVYARLPKKFRALCDGLIIRVEDFPTDEVLDEMGVESEFDLLGLFQGVGLPFRSESAPVQMPNMVWLYRRPILDYWAEHDEALGTIVAHVLVHEIGHHFGLSDANMEAIEAAAG